MTRSDNKCRAIWAKTLAEKFYDFRVDTYTLERKIEWLSLSLPQTRECQHHLGLFTLHETSFGT